VIDNSGTLEDLERRIEELWPQIEALGVQSEAPAEEPSS
jgi:hypothetical protein